MCLVIHGAFVVNHSAPPHSTATLTLYVHQRELGRRPLAELSETCFTARQSATRTSLSVRRSRLSLK